MNRKDRGKGNTVHEKPRLFDSSIVGTSQEAVDFITNILESSTEYSVIAKDLTGKIVLWNEGARRLYGYEPDEVVGKVSSSILHTPQDVKLGVPEQIMRAALEQGKWEGTLTRQRRNGEQFTARVVITPRRDAAGKPMGFLLISKDISDEIRLTEYARSLIAPMIEQDCCPSSFSRLRMKSRTASPGMAWARTVMCTSRWTSMRSSPPPRNSVCIGWF